MTHSKGSEIPWENSHEPHENKHNFKFYAKQSCFLFFYEKHTSAYFKIKH